jgi:hypothetical protein
MLIAILAMIVFPVAVVEQLLELKQLLRCQEIIDSLGY